MSKSSYVLSYDVGGSHATAGLVDSASLAIRFADSTAIDSNGSAASILDALQSLGEKIMGKAAESGGEVLGISIAMPGPFDYERGISLLRHKYASLYEMNLRSELAKRFRVDGSKIVFLNDAQAFLLGENHAGAAKNARRCIGITLGTGVGSSFSVEGRIVSQGEGVPQGGEIYCLPWEGGIVEDKISTRSIQKQYRERTGQEKSVRDVCLAAAQDPVAAAVMHQFGTDLGLVLKQFCKPFQPEAIIFGGAISRSAPLFEPSAIEAAGAWLQGRMRVSELLDNAPTVGAAVRCLDVLGQKKTA